MDGVGRFREVLPMLMDPVAFAGAVVSGDAVGGCRVPSRGMERHRATLRSCGVASDARSRPAFAMKAFTTPKKDGRTARLVLDARPLNDAMRRPPSMDLPRLRDFIAEVERHRFAMQCDGVSYFYQFPVDASISRYFGIGMKGCDMLLNVLCMGWSWAPCIAQRASNVLVRDLGLAWVDNFLVLGGTLDEAERNVAVFRKRAQAARVEVRAEGDDALWQVRSRFVCVGVEFDLAAETRPPHLGFDESEPEEEEAHEELSRSRVEDIVYDPSKWDNLSEVQAMQLMDELKKLISNERGDARDAASSVVGVVQLMLDHGTWEEIASRLLDLLLFLQFRTRHGLHAAMAYQSKMARERGIPRARKAAMDAADATAKRKRAPDGIEGSKRRDRRGPGGSSFGQPRSGVFALAQREDFGNEGDGREPVQCAQDRRAITRPGRCAEDSAYDKYAQDRRADSRPGRCAEIHPNDKRDTRAIRSQTAPRVDAEAGRDEDLFDSRWKRLGEEIKKLIPWQDAPQYAVGPQLSAERGRLLRSFEEFAAKEPNTVLDDT
ncbi:hypothetical protein DIPPA_11760, partial [Diplonema papillatum]